MKPNFECYRKIIPEFSLFQESHCQPHSPHLRVNRLKVEPNLLVDLLAQKGITLERATQEDDTLYFMRGSQSQGNLMEYFLGYIHPQALTSCLTSTVLSPKENSYVLDMCAAPGGKTSHMAQLMNNTGVLIANELYQRRHILLGHTLTRLGVLNTLITGYQAQEFPLKQRFDYILADVPCSGEGRFRSTQEAPYCREHSAKAKLPELQRKIVLRGFDLLKDNGQMLYATCTYNPEENESVVDFLLQNREAEILPVHEGLDYEPGVLEWRDKSYDKQLELVARFYPHRHNSVGFFMARIGKRG
jgi:NOL1/NOP2/sun family putative RNA methylase